MPTVTSVALDTLLEPGGPSSPSHQRQRRRGTSVPDKPGHSPVHSPVYDHRRRHSVGGPTSSPASSSRVRHHGAGREQQPVFLSRQPPQASPAATGSQNTGRSKDVDKASTAAGGAGRNDRALASGVRFSTNGYYISPKLYATPESTRLVVSGSALASSPTFDPSNSPYVVNHKRRGVSRPPPAPPGASHPQVAEINVEMKHQRSGVVAGELISEKGGDEVCRGGGQDGDGNRKMGRDGNTLNTNCNGHALDENECRPVATTHNDEEDDFLDPREMMSAVSSSDTEDGSSFCGTASGRYRTPLSNQSEFYDASEDFLSDGSVSRSSPSACANIEADIHLIRFNLFEEIDRRKKAEEALAFVQNMFQRAAKQLSQVQLPLPSIQPVEVEYDVEAIAQLCQEVVVTKFVFEAAEISLACAEAEAAAEAVIEAKNHEVTRLRDRLQYYEAMNHEMSQRNQVAMELARRRRLRRKLWQRWVWGCVGLSITVGASLLAYSCLPHVGRTPSLASSECEESFSETMEHTENSM